MDTAFDMQMEPEPYRPIFYLFYGTLTRPEVLKQVLGIQEEPTLRPAKVLGYVLSAWGQYPALIDGDTGTEVCGYAYEVQTVDHEYRLAYYETNAFKLRACKIYFTDGKEPETVTGNTFAYAGDAQALKAGRFDRVLWELQMGMRLPETWKTQTNGFLGLEESATSGDESQAGEKDLSTLPTPDTNGSNLIKGGNIGNGVAGSKS
ncbi:putative gamma-glutamylcyclotransferase [Seiridium cardinale]|uniref:Gamma-glutamylcyclotransferase n=1 Tax=Seiridium cardinale TaxID=138064 RepID=A0ABR2Y9P4_9PEZI